MSEKAPKNYGKILEEMESKGLGHWDEDGEWVRDLTADQLGLSGSEEKEEEEKADAS